MSRRRTSGSSRPSLGVQVLAVFPSFPRENRSSRNLDPMQEVFSVPSKHLEDRNLLK